MFELHSRLAKDCFQIGDFSLCRLLLMNDRNYPWFILVPRVAGVEEIYQLSQADQVQLMVESSVLSEVLMLVFSGDKMNVAALGNVVPQLHMHHIVRYKSDAVWPDPVWGKKAALVYEKSQKAEMLTKLDSALAAAIVPFASLS